MDGHHRMRRKTKIHVPNRYLPEASTSEETFHYQVDKLNHPVDASQPHSSNTPLSPQWVLYEEDMQIEIWARYGLKKWTFLL